MGNDNMHVMVMASNKGGCGKTMMAKAFGSAALGAGYKVCFVDADVNGNLYRWFETATELGNWPENGRATAINDPSEVSSLIDTLYEDGTADLVLVDTEGVGSETLEQMCLLADSIVTPIKITKDDFETTLRFKMWFEGFSARVKGDLPNQMYVINDMNAATPDKLPSVAKVYYKKIRDEYRTALTPLRSSAIFHRMDAEGPLYTLAQKTADEEMATKRITLTAANKALSNATTVMNDVIRGTIYAQSEVSEDAT